MKLIPCGARICNLPSSSRNILISLFLPRAIIALSLKIFSPVCLLKSYLVSSGRDYGLPVVRLQLMICVQKVTSDKPCPSFCIFHSSLEVSPAPAIVVIYVYSLRCHDLQFAVGITKKFDITFFANGDHRVVFVNFESSILFEIVSGITRSSLRYKKSCGWEILDKAALPAHYVPFPSFRICHFQLCFQ